MVFTLLLLLLLLLLLQIDSLFFAMSAPADADIQPQFDWTSSSVYHSIYYVVFMVISHGTLQLFVGVSILFFSLSQKKREKCLLHIFIT